MKKKRKIKAGVVFKISNNLYYIPWRPVHQAPPLIMEGARWRRVNTALQSQVSNGHFPMGLAVTNGVGAAAAPAGCWLPVARAAPLDAILGPEWWMGGGAWCLSIT